MTTSEHIAAIEAVIQRAGGPDRVRFCPVATELLEQTPVQQCERGPLLVWLEEKDGLAEITFMQPDYGEYARQKFEGQQ